MRKMIKKLTDIHLSLFYFSRNFYHFLITQEPEIAYEVRQDYVQTMSKLYFSYFKVCVIYNRHQCDPFPIGCCNKLN